MELNFHRNDSRNKVAENCREANVHFEYTSHWDKDESIFRNAENITTLKRIFKKKITTKGGKGQYEQKKAEEEEDRKRDEDARRLAQEAESWFQSEEEEKRKVEQEATRNAEEAARSEEEQRKRKMDSSLSQWLVYSKCTFASLQCSTTLFRESFL